MLYNIGMRKFENVYLKSDLVDKAAIVWTYCYRHIWCIAVSSSRLIRQTHNKMRQ